MDAQSLVPETKAFVNWILYQLTPREQRILEERYGLWDGISKTWEEVGELFAISRQRTHQIQNRCHTKLRQLLDPLVLDQFIRTKLHSLLDSQFETCGVLNQQEAVTALADDCSTSEAEIAASFLKALREPSRDIFSSCLSELEQGIYSVDPKVSAEYASLLDATKRVLEEHKKPLEEDKLWGEVSVRLTAFRGSPKVPLFTRMLAISPSFVRLQDERIVLSHLPDDLTSLTEQAMRDLGKSAHYIEITRRIVALRPERGPINERTVHNVLVSKKEKFVWTSRSTYGLKEWGIQRPPFVKDRLVQLLSSSRAPLSYEYLKQKVLEVCNCNENSIRMTLDLNHQLFRKFHNDRYGLRKHDGKDELAIRLSKEERAKQKKQRTTYERLRKLARKLAEHPDATPDQLEGAKKMLALLAEKLSGEN